MTIIIIIIIIDMILPCSVTSSASCCVCGAIDYVYFIKINWTTHSSNLRPGLILFLMQQLAYLSIVDRVDF